MGAALIRRAAALGLLSVAAPAAAVRPTDGAGWQGNGYDPGVPVFSYPSAAGHFRVHYVTESLDAVQPGDADGDGVPDFVELVAERADTVWASAVDERGYRPPLDDSIYHDTSDFGGDGRYDIYLMQMVGTDGYLVAEVCTATPTWCSGYFAMENDFAGFGYPSDDLAIRVLTSHEFFHAIQNAYDADQDRKWTEGTAVWNEERVFPEQSDYEGFLRYFLEKPERPFDRKSAANFSDLYPYGAALWPTFLAERYGDDVVRVIWEACEDLDGSDPDFLEAADLVLARDHGSSLGEAWIEFTQWNLMTGERADPARAYAGAATWPSVRLEAAQSGLPAAATVKSEGMSARYVPFTLPDLGGETARLTVATPTGAPVVGTAYLWDGAALGEAIPVDQGDDPAHRWADLAWTGTPTLFVVVTGVQRGALSHDVHLTLDLAPPPDPPPPDDSPPEETGCGCMAARRAPAPWAAVLAAASLSGFLRLRGRGRLDGT